jgi:hypothetical protein
VGGVKRPRTERRERERAAEKLARDREKLARRCGAEPRVETHDAPVVLGRPLRLVRLACPMCGGKREVWFRIGEALPS